MEKTYKIGIDARLWNETGVGRYIRNLVKELQILDKKNEYVLFILSKDKEEISETLRLRSGKNDQSSIVNDKWSTIVVDIRWHSLAEQQKFPKILEKENLDLVHFPYFSVPVGYSKPFVVTIHDLILHHFPTGKASTLPKPIYFAKHFGYKFIISQAAKKAKKIIAVSDTTANQIVKDLKVKKDKIVVTHEGVDKQIVNPKSQIPNNDAKYKIRNTQYFLYVGNVYPHKNAKWLLQAFKLFKNDAIEDTKLIFVGKDDYFYQDLKKQIEKLDLETNVKIFTNIADAELASLYEHAYALVVPSLMEGFGLPGLEAMANNCVVIASNIPSLKEIYQDAALYIEPTSIESIAEGLKKVYFMQTDEKNKLHKKGKEQVKKFSWKEMAAQTLQVYESSIGIR